MTAAAKPAGAVKGRHVLIAVAGFFAVVVGLDSLFVVWAVQSFPGEVSERAYEDGLDFNRKLVTRRAQASLGWTARVTQGARPGEIRVRFTDSAGASIEGLRVRADFTRPATDAGAGSTTLRAVGPGTYGGRAVLPGGAWDLTLTTKDARGRAFEARRRLVWR